METKVTLDRLTPDNVSLKKQQYAVIDGHEYSIGEPWRKAYTNNESGRKEVESEISEPYKTAIFAVWGETQTVD